MCIRVGVDIDDTLCDFVSPLNDWVNKKRGTSYSISQYTTQNFFTVWSLSYDDSHSLIHKFITETDCRDLKPFDGAYDTLLAAKKTGYFEFYAVTARDSRLTSATSEWLELHFEGIFTDVILCNTFGEGPRYLKTSIYKQYSISLVIDDRPSLSPKYESIVHDRPWNRDIVGPRITDWKSCNLLTVESVIERLSKSLASTPILIGLSGKLGSGKDEAYKVINSVFSTFSSVAYATKVKEVVALLTGTTLAFNTSREGKRTIPNGFTQTLGQLHQVIGQGMKSLVGECVWINSLMNSELPYHCVITDCRLKLETEAILAREGLLVRVNGDPVGIRAKNEDGRDLNHISETDLDDYPFEYVVENDGTLEEFRERLMRMVVGYLHRKLNSSTIRPIDRLLSIQSDTTLSEWRKERGIEDNIDISDYYSYLDLLSIPNHDISLPNEVVHNIYTWLPSYALSSAKCTCRLWSNVHVTGTLKTTYYEDAAYEMSWYHLANFVYTDDTMVYTIIEEAAKRGYQLQIGRRYSLTDLELCLLLSQCSDGSERYSSLFSKHFTVRDDTAVGKLSTIIDNCAKRGDTVMYYCIRSKYNDQYQLEYIAATTASRYGHIHFLQFMISKGIALQTNVIDECIIAAYCGGHYNNVTDFFGKKTPYRVVLRKLLTDMRLRYEIDSLESLIFLFENCDYNMSISNLRHLETIDFTIGQLLRLWELIRDKTSPTFLVISTLALCKKNEELLLFFPHSGLSRREAELAAEYCARQDCFEAACWIMTTFVTQ